MKTPFLKFMDNAKQKFIESNGDNNAIKNQQAILAAEFTRFWGVTSIFDIMVKQADPSRYDKMTKEDIQFLENILTKYQDSYTPEERFFADIFVKVIYNVPKDFLKQMRRKIEVAIPNIDEKCEEQLMKGCI